MEEVVIQKSQSHAPPAITDDKIADKHPVYDPYLVITERFGDCDVTLNKSGSVTKLDVLPWGDGEAALKGKIFRSRVAALVALGDRPVLPSMEIINGALKPFDDGLYAAVELGAEDGSNGSLIAKAALFKDLLAELVTRAASGTATEQPLAHAAAAQIGAAILAGGGTSCAAVEHRRRRERAGLEVLRGPARVAAHRLLHLDPGALGHLRARSLPAECGQHPTRLRRICGHGAGVERRAGARRAH